MNRKYIIAVIFPKPAIFIIAPHDAGHRPETIKTNKSLCGVPRGGFFRKSPGPAGGIFLFSW
jgi:hypothetical protein